MQDYLVLLFSITFFSSVVFTIEYVLRIIAAPANYPGVSEYRARLKYLLSFFGIIDFIAILPFVLLYLFYGSEIATFINVAHIFIIFKMVRYSQSFQMIGEVLSTVKNELFTAYATAGIVVCFSAILMYYVERKAQPEVFTDIGEGFWWAVITFTTVGYGDVYPITPAGKFLGGIISMVGISMIALPTGLLSSAFMNRFHKRYPSAPQTHLTDNMHYCPTCGKPVHEKTNADHASNTPNGDAEEVPKA
jgi:voltage-gated potassium channel